MAIMIKYDLVIKKNYLFLMILKFSFYKITYISKLIFITPSYNSFHNL